MGAYAAAVGRVIRSFREEQGLSQEELGHRASIHRTYVGGIERGERNVTLDSLKRVADGLNVRPSEILARVDAES